MNILNTLGLQTLVLGAAIVAAPVLCAEVPDAALVSDVVILGEIHDNQEHHRVQADWVSAIKPRAIVFEMLRPEEAAALNATPREAADFSKAMVEFHWSNINDYVSIMLSVEAPLVGAAQLPAEVRSAFSEGAAAVFGDNAASFGLTAALPEPQRKAREELQFEAHCEAMPLDMMGGMIEAQRFRDASFAREVLRALQEYGAPLVLITGNGHARRDWGVPAFLERVSPDVSVFVLGQSEDQLGASELYDLMIDTPAPDRSDPCAAFR